MTEFYLTVMSAALVFVSRQLNRLDDDHDDDGILFLVQCTVYSLLLISSPSL